MRSDRGRGSSVRGCERRPSVSGLGMSVLKIVRTVADRAKLGGVVSEMFLPSSTAWTCRTDHESTAVSTSVPGRGPWIRNERVALCCQAREWAESSCSERCHVGDHTDTLRSTTSSAGRPALYTYRVESSAGEIFRTVWDAPPHLKVEGKGRLGVEARPGSPPNAQARVDLEDARRF